METRSAASFTGMRPNSSAASLTASRTAAGISLEDLHEHLTPFVDHAVGFVFLLTLKLSACLAVPQEAPTRFPCPAEEGLGRMSALSPPDHLVRMQHGM